MRQPDKKRYLNAVNHIEGSEVPLFELEADPAIVSAMLGKPVDMSLHSYELPTPDLMEWNRLMGNDMVYFAHIWHLGRKEIRDADGRVHYVDGVMKTRESMSQIVFPDMDRIRRRLDEVAAAAGGAGLGLMVSAMPPGFTVATAIGYQDFCIAVMEDPTFVLDFQARIAEYAMRELEMYLTYPVDVVRIGSGLTTNNGAVLNPEMMERYEFHWLRQIAARVKAAGKFLMFHIDGKLDSVLPTLMEMGTDVLHPIDICGGQQDIYQLKRQWGHRFTLHGNIDVNEVMLKGTPDEVAEDVRRHIDGLAKGGGYVVGSSHDLHQMLPLANIYAMRDAVHAHRFRAK